MPVNTTADYVFAVLVLYFSPNTLIEISLSFEFCTLKRIIILIYEYGYIYYLFTITMLHGSIYQYLQVEEGEREKG